MGELPYPGRAIQELGTTRIGFPIGGHQAEFVNWGFFDAQPWRNYLHAHSFFEICYAYAGRGDFHTGGSALAVSAGDVFVARPGDVHEIVSSNEKPLGIHFWSYTLLPAPRGARNDPDRALLEAFTLPEGDVVARTDRRLPLLLETLSWEAASGSPSAAVVHALCAALVLETARLVGGRDLPTRSRPEAGAPSGDLAVRTMRRYVSDNYQRPVTVRDVAAQVHLSERHAGRLFQTATGTTIHAYLTKVRLETAAQHLVSGSDSIKEIARCCGYPDVRHFTGAFRRRWGMTPAAFRAEGGTSFAEAGEKV